jgi:peptidyl-tRNA hydrolase, PTH1 family
MTWLVAGLGNPGERYARTRHNAGVMTVEELVRRAGEKLRRVRWMPVEVAEVREGSERVLLARSTQFMNVSGPGFASLAKRQHVPMERVVACHDEIDLPFGALNVKLDGGTAGHHGIESMVEAFRSRDFYRVRLGIGRPPGRVESHPDWLLDPFTKKEQSDIEILVQDAADAVSSLITDGLEKTQERFNRR